MMKPIKDCEEKVVCYVDESTGKVEIKYKQQKASTCLHVGGEYTIERERTTTILKRKSEKEIEVFRYFAA